jgi:hypothetical protein
MAASESSLGEATIGCCVGVLVAVVVGGVVLEVDGVTVVGWLDAYHHQSPPTTTRRAMIHAIMAVFDINN